MAITSGFHNSKNGDRVYSASQMNEPYKHLVSNGVVPNPSDSLLVSPGNGLTVVVNSGFALIGSGWIRVNGSETIALDPAESTLKRIDMICLRWDDTDSVRTGTIVYKKGTPASSPVAPTLEKNDLVEELCLAKITMNAGVAVVTSAMITDTRGDASLCGYTTNLIKNDSGTRVITLTLPASDWASVSDGYTQTLTVNGITDTSTLIVFGDNGVVCVEQGENSLKFKSPTNLLTNVKIIDMGIL